jgi:hypothetical protein
MYICPLEGYGDWREADLESRWPERKFLPPGPQQLSFDIEECFMKSIPSQFEASQRAMKILRDKYPGRKIIQVSEGMYSGSLPITRGARGLKPDGTLGIGIIPLSLTGVDTAPFGPGILPNASLEGRAKHKVMDGEIHEAFFGSAEKTWFQIFEDLGVKTLLEGHWIRCIRIQIDSCRCAHQVWNIRERTHPLALDSLVGFQRATAIL